MGTSEAFTAGSVTTMNFHGWMPNELGLSTSACSSVDQRWAGILRAGSNFLVA